LTLLTALRAIIEYVSRPNSGAAKDIDIDIGKSDIDPPLSHTVITVYSG